MTAVVAANAVCVEAERLWDMVVVDVSEDMECESIRSGMSEAVMRDSVAGNLLRMGYRNVPALMFSGGRLMATLGDCADMKFTISGGLAYVLGYGSPIYETVVATLNASPRAERLLLLSNGRASGDGVTATTCARLLAPYGVTVDAVRFSLDCDSICAKGYDGNMPYVEADDGMKTLAEMTGGCYVRISEGDDATRKLASLIDECEKKERPVVAECGLDNGMMERYVASLPVNRFMIEDVATDQVLEFNDVIYDGLDGLHEAAGAQGDSESGIVGIVKASGGGEYILLDKDASSLAKRKKALTVWLAEHKANGLDTTLPLDFFPLAFYPGTGGRLQICGLWKSSREEFDEEE